MLLEILRQIHRVEDDRCIKVGEEDNQEGISHVIRAGARLKRVRHSLERRLVAECCYRSWHDDDRLREDYGHHARRIQADGNVCLGPFADSTAAHDLSWNLDRDSPSSHRQSDHTGDHADHDATQDHKLREADHALPDEVEGAENAGPHAFNYREEDEQAHPVSNTALGDLLSQPHHEHRSGGESENGDEPETPTRTRYSPRQRFGEDGKPVRLTEGETHSHVTGPLSDFLPALFFLLELFDVGEYGASQLEHDRRRDVWHDPQSQYRRPREPAPDEHIVDAEEGLRPLVPHEVRHDLDVDSRRGNVSTQPVDDQNQEGE